MLRWRKNRHSPAPGDPRARGVEGPATLATTAASAASPPLDCRPVLATLWPRDLAVEMTRGAGVNRSSGSGTVTCRVWSCGHQRARSWVSVGTIETEDWFHAMLGRALSKLRHGRALAFRCSSADRGCPMVLSARSTPQKRRIRVTQFFS